MEASAINQILMFIYEERWLLLVLTTILALYLYCTSTFDFFEKKGVAFMKPTICLGNLGPRLMAKKSSHEFDLDIYNYFKGKPCGGVFQGRVPVLYVFDPDLIKAVTVRDFDHFVDMFSLDSNEPRYLKRTLLNLKGKEWKCVRSALSPAFSSARLRNMLPLMDACSQQLVEFMKQYDGKNGEMMDIISHFTLDVIGACAFGIKCDALSDENAHFFKVAEKYLYLPKLKRFVLFALLMFTPKLLRLIDISLFYRESTDELVRMLKVAIAERRSSDLKKNDLLQILIEAAEKEKSNLENLKRDPYLDDDTIEAQSFLFLIAGFETSSVLLSFAIHTLATKPELQADLRSNIKEITDGKDITYELLSQMHYVEAFLLETLRMYPPFSHLERVCTKKYNLPGTSVTVDVGNIVAIPVYGLHMDPDYYPDPHEFKPERFMDDEKRDRHSHVFLPFGAGPRACMSYSFAMMSGKMAMIRLLNNYKFTVCEKTEDTIKFDKESVILKAGTGLWVRVDTM